TNPYYFRVSYIDSFEETVAAQFIYEQLQTTSVAVLLKDGNDYSSAMATEFVKAFESITGEEDIVDIVTVPENISDYGEYLVNMRYLSPSAIFFPGNIDEARSAIETSLRMGYNFTWVGTSNWDGLDIENVYYTLDYDPAKPTTELAAVLKRIYQDQYGQDKEPSNATALGFDAYLLAVKAIENAKAESGFFIKEALENVENLECATGYLTMSASGDPIKEVVVEKYENGERNVVYTMLPEKAARVDEEGETQ
ncbi:MAG: ABC transporter substrate-binding protein, partial [Bacillota bacterium]|nr:ABC transporter substrate-binding protein [Bacillota bacterium]